MIERSYPSDVICMSKKTTNWDLEVITMWLVFAILSAVFAALTSIFAKIGIEGVNSNLATAIRTVVVVIMA